MQLRRSWNGNDPRLLCQQPGECNLRRRHFLALGDPAEQIHHSLIRSAVLRREARDDIAKIALIELGFFADLPREKPFTKGAEWNESDAEFLERR